MTAQTLATLKASFPTSGAPGNITPTQFQNICDTMAARTGGSLGGGSWVRVTDPEFGADPTGVADSTTAFQNAMAAGPCIVPALTPAGARATYTLSNCIVPNGAVLVGGASLAFTGGGLSSDLIVAPVLQASSSAIRVLNIDGKKGISIEGLIITGAASSVANTCDGISAGGSGISLRNILVQYCRFGIGGAVSGSVATFPNSTWEATIFGCSFQVCITGLGGLVDSFIYGGSCSYNVNGCALQSGDSANTFHGTRFEWNGRTNAGNTPSPGNASGSGLNINGSDTNQFLGCEFDANGLCAVNLTSVAFMCSFVGCSFTRNGVNIASGTTLITGSAHVVFNSAFNIYFSGCTSRAGTDGSVFGPAAFANFVGAGGANGGIMFNGNDISGYQGSTAGASNLGPVTSNTLWRTGTVPTGVGVNSYVVKQNMGTGTAAQDIDTR